MQDYFNPYAAPTTLEMHPAASEWLGTPNESLRKVASGLGLIRTAVLLLVFVVIIFFVGCIFLGLNGGGRDTMQMLLVVFAVMVIVAQILNLVGSIFCLSTPQETGARGWIVASVVTEVLSMVISVGALLGVRGDGASGVQQLLGIIACVTFILFLRKLGLFIGRPDLAQRAINLLILWGVLFAIIVGSIVLTVLAAQQANGGLRFARPAVGPEILIAIGLSMIVLGIVAVVKYLSLLADMKSAILNGR
jgi:hypothetical protein